MDRAEPIGKSFNPRRGFFPPSIRSLSRFLIRIFPSRAAPSLVLCSGDYSTFSFSMFSAIILSMGSRVPSPHLLRLPIWLIVILSEKHARPVFLFGDVFPNPIFPAFIVFEWGSETTYRSMATWAPTQTSGSDLRRGGVGRGLCCLDPSQEAGGGFSSGRFPKTSNTEMNEKSWVRQRETTLSLRWPLKCLPNGHLRRSERCRKSKPRRW